MENLYLYLVLLLPFLFLIHYNFHRQQRYNFSEYRISFPIIGHLYLKLGNREKHEIFFQNLLTKYGSILLLKFGFKPILVVSCPKAVEECFTSNDVALANRPETLASYYLSYDYKVVSFVQHNRLWATLRSLMHKELLSNDCLNNSSVFRELENEDLLRNLARLTTTTTETIDLKNWFYLLAYNIAMRMVSGDSSEIKYEELATEDGKKILEEQMNMLRPNLPFSLCDFFPVLWVFRLLGMGNHFKIIHKNRNEFLQKIIDDFLKKKQTDGSSESDEKKTPTFIETMLQKKESDSNLYNNDLIKALLLSMFVAGTETSAVTMECAIFFLLNNPKELKRLREELDSQVETHSVLKDKDLDKLTFLKCVVMETLRLHPPVKMILPHLSKKECKVRGKDIPKGTTLLVNAWAMHRDPKVWEEPEKFKPERFASFESLKLDQEHIQMLSGMGYIPFGMGIRGCPGTAMALRTILLTVGSLVHCFDLKMDDESSKNDGKASKNDGKASVSPTGNGYHCSPKATFQV